MILGYSYEVVLRIFMGSQILPEQQCTHQEHSSKPFFQAKTEFGELIS